MHLTPPHPKLPTIHASFCLISLLMWAWFADALFAVLAIITGLMALRAFRKIRQCDRKINYWNHMAPTLVDDEAVDPELRERAAAYLKRMETTQVQEPVDTTMLTLSVMMRYAWLALLVILGYQVLVYLKTGDWLSLSLLDLAGRFIPAWADSPTDYFGAWVWMNTTPLWTFPLALIACFAFLRYAINEDPLRDF